MSTNIQKTPSGLPIFTTDDKSEVKTSSGLPIFDVKKKEDTTDGLPIISEKELELEARSTSVKDNVATTPVDKQIYNDNATLDKEGNLRLDVDKLLEKYNKLSASIPKDANLRMPTQDELDVIDGESAPIQTFETESLTPSKPTSGFEYVMGKGASQSLLFKSLNFLVNLGENVDKHKASPFKDTYTETQDEAKKTFKYFEKYDPNMMEDALAFGTGMFLDSGLFGGFGKIGQQGYKAGVTAYASFSDRLALSGVKGYAKKQALKQSAERLLASKGNVIASNIIQSGTALGGYSAFSDVANQVESGKKVEDLEWGHALKEGGKSFVLGAGLGAAGQVFGNLSYKTTKQLENVFQKRMVQTGFKTAEFGSENAIFLFGSAALDDSRSIKDITWGDAMKLGLELSVLKVSGALQSGYKGINKSENFDKTKTNKEEFSVGLDNIEKKYLGKKDIATDDIVKEFRDNKEYKESVLNDVNIPDATKYKLLWSTEGVKPAYTLLPTKANITKDGDNYILETFDSQNNKIESRDMGSEQMAISASKRIKADLVENQYREKIGFLDADAQVNIETDMANEGVELDKLAVTINKSPSERTGVEKKLMDSMFQKIDKYYDESIKQKAIEDLEQDGKPKYSIEGKEFETKEEFLKEVNKIEVTDKYPSIEVKNDEAITKKVADVLEDKIKATEKPLEATEAIKTEKATETMPDKKGEVIQSKTASVENKDENTFNIREKEVTPTKYKTKEAFKKDFLSDEANLNQIDVPLKVSERKAAFKNLKEGKQTKQAYILEEYLDKSFEEGKLRLVVEAAGKLTSRTIAPLESIIKSEPTEQDIYKEYAKQRALEDGTKFTSKQAEKTMNARASLINEIKLTVDPKKDAKLTAKKSAKEGYKFAKQEAKVKIEMINDYLKKAKDQKHITAFENKVIRNKLASVAGGTDYQLKEAIKYAEKVINNAEFRRQESEKINNVKQVEKELKSLRNKSSKFKTIKRAFNVPEVIDIIKEYEGVLSTKDAITGEKKTRDIDNLTNETVKSILEDIQRAKELAIKKYDKEAKYKEEKKAIEKRSLEFVKPVKGWNKGDAEYIKSGATETTPKSAAKERRWHAYDENLTSIFSKMASASRETGELGKDWLNMEFYHKKLLPAERNFKKFTKDETKKISDFVKKLYGKDVEVVLNELSREAVEVTVDIIDNEGNVTQNKKQITKGEAIKKWMELQDESLHARIFEPMRIQSDGKVIRGNGFTEVTVKEIEAAMNPKDLELANKLFDGYQELGKRYRDYFAEQFGIIFPEKQFYSNIYSEFTDTKDNTGQVVEDMTNNAPSGTIRANNAISRITNKNRIKDADALSSYFDYVDKMEWMYQFGEASEFYSTVINNDRFKRAVIITHGREMYNSLKEYERIINRDFENRDDPAIRAISKWFSSAALGMNPNIAIKQAFSITTAMTEVNPIEFAKRVPQFAVETTAALAGKGNDVSMLAKRGSITGRGRTGLGHDIYLDPKIRRDKVSHIPVLYAAKKIFSKGLEYQTKGIEWVDKGASLMGGYIVYKAKKAEYIKRGMSVADAEQQAGLDFDIFVDSTQQSQSMFNTSITRMNSGAVGKIAGMFTTAVSQFQRYEQNALRNIYTGITNKGEFKNKQVLKNVASVIILRQLIPMLYQLASDGWKWDEKNQTAAAVMGNATGLFILGKLATKAKNTLQGDNYDAQVLPVIDNIQRAFALSSDFKEMLQYPELYTEQQKNKIKTAYIDALGYATGVGTRGIRIAVAGDFIDFFDGSRSDQNKLGMEAVKTGDNILDILEKEYGEEFVYNDDGNLNPGAKGYVREYLFQEERSDYGSYADNIYEVMNMYDYRDKVTYLLKLKKKMTPSDFDDMMDELVYPRTYGSKVDRKTGKRKQITVGSYMSKSVYDKVYAISED